MTEQLPPPSNLTTADEFNKYTSTSRAEQWLLDNFMRSLESAMSTDQRVRRVLEIGVGEGHVSERVAATFPDADVVGIDLPHDSMAERWHRRDVRGVFADAVQLPFPDATFDLVLAIEVLEHMPRPSDALAELTRVGCGHAVLSVPLEPLWRLGNMVRGRYLRDWGNTPDHIQHWTRGGFRRLVEQHLSVQKVRSPLPWTLIVAHV